MVLYHFRLGIWGGYLLVEGFFMISGYLMFSSLQRNRERAELPDSTAVFLWRKYRSMFLPLLFSAISGFLIYELIVFAPMEASKVWDIPRLVFEIFPLQIAGFPGKWTTGVAWYVSAMLLAMAILHPIAKKKPEHAAYTVCPILALLLYGCLGATYGHLGVITDRFVGVVATGLLRALAGISAGMVLSVLVERGKEWRPSLGTKIALSAAELLGIGALCIPDRY